MTAALPATGARSLVFEVRGRRFALDIGAVEEIIPSRRVVPAPLAPRFISGVINLRGNVVTVLSLGELLGLPRTGVPPLAQVVLRLPGAALAVEVEELLGISALDAGAAGESELESAPGLPGVRSVVQHGDHPLYLLDPDALGIAVGARENRAASAAGIGGRP